MKASDVATVTQVTRRWTPITLCHTHSRPWI